MKLTRSLPAGLTGLFAVCSPALHAQLLLTEINSNGSAGDYWEITNVGAASVDLSGYRWTDGEASGTFAGAAAWALAPGTTIAAGESIVFTKVAESAFRTWWGAYLPAGAKVFSATASPGLGGNDGAKLFDSTGAAVITFSYAAGGFTKADNGASLGGHAGASAGGTSSQAAVWIPASGAASPRYTFADGSTNGTTVSATNAADMGSPGYSGFGGSGPTITLGVSALPESFSESAANPASTGTVTRAVATTSDLVVNLSSSDTTEATVPATVTILANQTSATFPITAVDDTFPDANKTATITASATDATSPTVALTVQDDSDVFPHQLLLTEIHSDQDASPEDFWELTNVGSNSADISGYSWIDSPGSYSASLDKVPNGTTLAPGESVIFTAADPTAFRDVWGGLESVKVIHTPNAPGLGKNDGVKLFESSGNQVFFVSYAAGGFDRADGTDSKGEHAGYSASPDGAVEAVEELRSMIWVPTSGIVSPRYTVADGTSFGSRAIAGFGDVGSPGVTNAVAGTGFVSIASASISEGNTGTSTLALDVTRTETSSAFAVDYTVTGGTADGADYTLASGTLNFTAGGVDSQPVNIIVNGDTDSEPDETVVVTLSNIVNTTGTTTLGEEVGTGTILADDVFIATQPVSTAIVSGGVTTLFLDAIGSPAPTIQWYQGNAGDTSTPVGTDSRIFVTPALAASTSYWARLTNGVTTVDTSVATVSIVPAATGVNLATYVRTGRHGLPEPTRTALPAGTAAHNLLCQEASGVAYNWDTDTLFISCDGGRSITQVSKTGQLIDTMSLDLQTGAPQGTAFYDPEGITYVGGGQFVFSEERDQQLVKFTYVPGTTLTRANAQTVDLGPFDDNTGTEGLSWDPPASDFIALKEKSPIGVFRTGVDFTAGTATTAPPTSGNEASNLFNTSLLGMTDVADVFAFTNIPSMAGQPQEASLLVLGQENARVVTISRSGTIGSTLNITADPGDTISPPDMQHEGITMDRAGNIYIVNENGGGNINFPELWVYSTTTLSNTAPTAVAVNNAVTSIQENANTASPVKVGDIVVSDDGLGTNALSLTGADAASFEITGTALYLKAGVTLDFETKASYAVTVNVDDSSVGTTPDATANFTLTVTDQEPETPVVSGLLITEVVPWASSNSPVAKDWLEVTNTSEDPVTITGWKVDDNSNSSALAGTIGGVTTIAPGESVVLLMEVTEAELPALATTFINTWFNGTAPSGFQIGCVTGGGIGLGSGASGDAVNLFNATGVLQAKLTFGVSDAVSPYQTFDNTVAADNVAVSLLSSVGVNGAFLAPNSAEVGSPGYSAPAVLRITEVAPWSSGNSPIQADWFEVTNTGARPKDMTGWKFDDVSESSSGASALAGISSIAPGESVIYIQTTNLASARTAFLNNWFGANPPAGLQIGSHNGDGLGTSGDAVNLFDSNNVRRAKVTFGVSPSAAPFGTFDNTAKVDAAAVTLKAFPSVNGAFNAANSAIEVGSPGSVVSGGPLAFATWLSANGYSSFGLGADSDSDGLTDGVEYFFNQSPNNGSDTGNTPQLVSNGGALELDFTRLTNAGGMIGSLEVSGDLATWVPALSGLDYVPAGAVVNGTETAVTYSLPGTGPSAPSPSAGYLTPNTSDPVGASLGGVRVVNEGLVGVGRLSGENVDVFGETQGAASGLFITGWAYNAGQFTGKFQVLPDRGYGDGSSNYAARIHEVDFTFTPYYGTTATAQGQVQPVYNNVSTKFTYVDVEDGSKTKFTTGLNPDNVGPTIGARTGTLFGQTVGLATAANGLGGNQESLLSFDAEAVHLFPDGSGFVSDEYGTYIARFDATKKITGLTQLPGAAQPHKTGAPNFNSLGAPDNGRRNNQGIEGMSVTPDGTRLFALLQSATVQDTNGGAQQTRNHARLFVYDIVGAKRENPELVGEYIVRLPQIDLNSDGSALDGTAAQSEIVALGPNSFLMLPRDGNGLGKLNSPPILFKSVQLVDFASATNIRGLFDGVGQAVSPAGVLDSSVTAAATAEVINMLQPDDLAKFGLNTTIPANSNTLNEKIEGMALAPDLSTEQPNDFFLFVANDNDFQSSDVKMLNAAGVIQDRGDGRLTPGVTNDAMYYVWRLTIDASGKKFFRMDVTGNP
ncbi:lamin tail domain-containing protein [Luteolibacter arcticus]|uniref:Lamin tail domain-containing protein n=1 Tax=Luteolibacter arcticus TaxID=1581411 RepID=A0ABT3GL78_9BACT|nr:lamin tail domain-containing protein [Luteolibacter arcticus]MCW1924280.1 lamin tail domain-containing protein [Luteolibacter arcticus]